jgi:hypothetical protein
LPGTARDVPLITGRETGDATELVFSSRFSQKLVHVTRTAPLTIQAIIRSSAPVNAMPS